MWNRFDTQPRWVSCAPFGGVEDAGVVVRIDLCAGHLPARRKHLLHRHNAGRKIGDAHPDQNGA
jgi:hypothetical protein